MEIDSQYYDKITKKLLMGATMSSLDAFLLTSEFNIIIAIIYIPSKFERAGIYSSSIMMAPGLITMHLTHTLSLVGLDR